MRGIDRAQSTIEFEVVALIFLDKPACNDNLEYIASQAVLDTLAYVGLMLLVGQWRCSVAPRMEVVGMHIRLVHSSEDVADSIPITSFIQRVKWGL